MNATPRFLIVFALLFCLFPVAELSAQQVSCSVQTPPNDPAAQAFEKRDYVKARDLYSVAAKSNPKNMEAIAGEVRSLIELQQISDAADLAEKSFAANSKSAILATALGEVRFRQGKLTDAFAMYKTAMILDPCLARTRYDIYKGLWVESMNSSAYVQLQAAYQLEPNDPDIHLAWVERLPLKDRASEIDSYLSTGHDASTEEQSSLKEYSTRLHAILATKKGNCRLTSSSSTTTLPFQYLEKDELNGFHSLGLEIKVNDKASPMLILDTGASGILLDHFTAQKAGLVPITSDRISGIGDDASTAGYWAYADDLRIGSLEFKNCLVEVSNKHSIIGSQGLIGADVFENYHVQLDFPMRQMTLSALPQRPGETTADANSLNASGVGNASAATHPENGSTGKTGSDEIHYFDRYISPEMKSWSTFARFGHQILMTGQLKDKEPRLFLLDSGSNVSILSIPAAKSIGKLHFDGEDQLTGLNGRVNRLYTVNNVNIEFAGLRDPMREIIVMDMDGLSKGNGTEVSGIVGLDTLRYLVVDIDYRDGLIHLTYDPKHGANRYQ